jgi:hypothetical protein
LTSDSDVPGLDGSRLLPGTCPSGTGVPGTLGDRPEGAANGEPPGAQVAGGCAPCTGTTGASPGRLRSRLVASCASAAVSNGEAGMGVVTLKTLPLYL